MFAAACATFLGTPLPAAAQGATLSPVVVTATREPQPLVDVVADVVVFDTRAIRDSGADSLEDLLRRAGAIQLSRNGGPGQSAAVLMRGNGAGSTVVLVDGVRIGSVSLGQADFTALPLSQIERIEILRGPGSSLYGADAVGGVVQIFTHRGRAAPSFAAQVAVGGLASRESEVRASGLLGDFDLAASASTASSDGVSAIRPADRFGQYNPDHDGFSRHAAQLRAGFAPAPGHRVGVQLARQRLDVQYDGAEFLPPDFSPDPSADFRNRARTGTRLLEYRGELTPQWTTTLQWSRQEDRSTAGGAELSRYDTARRQLTWQNAWAPSASLRLLAALERMDESVDSTAYGAPQRRNTGIVLGGSGSLGAHRWQADLRHDDNSVYGGVNTGKLGWSMPLDANLVLRAVAGTAFRAPTFNDLYFPGYGVSSVQPERSRSIEVGLRWSSAADSVGATLFRNRVRDLIGYQPDRSFCPAGPEFDFGCAGNVSRARLRGATFDAHLSRGPLALRATLDLLDAKDELTGQRLTRRAAHQASLAVDWTQGAWMAGAQLIGVGRRPEGGADLAAYETLDLRLQWRPAPSWRLEASLRNALDRDFEPARDYAAPGRQAWLALRYDLAGF